MERFEIRRKLSIIVLLLASLIATAQTRQFEGRWWLGMLEEASLPLNLTFDGGKPVLYSPMQSDQPMVATKWSFSGDTLRITEGRTGVKMTLRWNASDSTFAGTFRQGLLRTEMTLRPCEGLYKPFRPQTPQPPYPYTEEEITVVYKKKTGTANGRCKVEITLSGTLTMPQGKGPFPAVVLVSGSGQQNRDEELMGHRPFQVLADYLARHGIAVLRYDDLGVGGSKIVSASERCSVSVTELTTFDFADDAEAVFETLRKHKGIDPRRVGIAGHSEGGMIAPIVASRNRHVSFIVTMGGPGVSGADILLQQNELIMRLNGIPDSLVKRHDGMLHDFFGMADTMPDERIQPVLVELCEQYSQGLGTDERKQASLRRGDAIAMAAQMQIPWMRTFIAIDNSVYLSQTECPILALNGEKDCQVPPQNLEAIAKATGGRADIRLMPGLNHLMQHCTTGSPQEYMLIEETMATEAMEEIAKWINGR